MEDQEEVSLWFYFLELRDAQSIKNQNQNQKQKKAKTNCARLS